LELPLPSQEQVLLYFDARFLDQLHPACSLGGKECPERFRLAGDDFGISELAAGFDGRVAQERE